MRTSEPISPFRGHGTKSRSRRLELRNETRSCSRLSLPARNNARASTDYKQSFYRDRISHVNVESVAGSLVELRDSFRRKFHSSRDKNAKLPNLKILDVSDVCSAFEPSTIIFREPSRKYVNLSFYFEILKLKVEILVHSRLFEFLEYCRTFCW